jgi:ElaB/YqjD/DUF883 family membrane-anchored ribosome-binding protein
MTDKKTPGAVTFEPAAPLEATGEVSFDPAGTATSAGAGAKKPAAEAIREEAAKLGSQAADRARSFAGEGKARASGAIGEFSKMMEDAAAQVDEKLGEQYGQYARSAAQSLGGFAQTLESKDVDELMEEARQFVRRSPTIAIGTAAALGFVFARIVKAGVEGENAPGRDGPSA